MALNFPASPSNGQEYVAPNGVTYIYDAAAGLWYVKTSDAIGTTDIADSAITTAKLADDAVTGGKLANDITISTTGDLTANSLTLPTAPVVGYQQGLWTPYYSLLDGSGAISNYDSQAGTFTRIGNQITAYFYCITRSAGNGSWSYQNGASNATATIIAGLPYIQSAGNPVGSGFLTWGTQLGRTANSTPALTDITVWVSGGDSKLRLNKRFAQGDGTYGYANVEMADFILNSGAGFQGVATYVTDDTTWAPINGATVS